MKKIVSLAAVGVTIFLAGCAGGHSGGATAYSGSSYGNYKCTATSGSGKSSLGWASDESRARANALDKCQERNGGSCSITGCINAS